MDPRRFNHSNCSDMSFSVFIGALTADKNINILNHKPLSDNCHFIRYNVKSGQNKASIVYDTKAKILTFTASDDFIDCLNDLYYKSVASLQKNLKSDENDVAAVLKDNVKESSAAFKRKTADLRQKTDKSPKNEAENKIKHSSGKAKSEEEQDLLRYKNGYSVKNFSEEKLSLLLKRIRTSKIKIKLSGVSDKGTSTEMKSYSIEDDKHQKVILRFMPAKKVIQLQGKRSSLFGEVQVILNKDTDYKSALNSHKELTGEQKRAGEIERQLKKALPNAYKYLSEQSKIDLSIGLMDIMNNEVRLSDYSVLLVPPYRGLERLIYDLQQSKGIDVKLIGQAFERPDGVVYELKSGYKKKINSVVYCEVMTSLYTEYFEKRNFYAHSDNSVDSVSRFLGDKSTAKEIFDRLLKIIDYNCKKLTEIGFTVKNNKGGES